MAASWSRPWIGAGGQAVTADLAEGLKLDRPRGVIIGNIYKGGAAERAGLQVGDVVIAINGHTRSPIRPVAALPPSDAAGRREQRRRLDRVAQGPGRRDRAAAAGCAGDAAAPADGAARPPSAGGASVMGTSRRRWPRRSTSTIGGGVVIRRRHRGR